MLEAGWYRYEGELVHTDELTKADGVCENCRASTEDEIVRECGLVIRYCVVCGSEK